MDPNEWRNLKQILINKGFDVSVKGRNKKEYLGLNSFMSVDIYRGGITGTGSTIYMYVFDSNQKLVYEVQDKDVNVIVDTIDCFILDYEEFGDLVN